MILLVDVGNTRIKWRCLNDSSLVIDSGVLLNKIITEKYLENSLPIIGVDTIYLSSVSHEHINSLFKNFAKKNCLSLHFVAAQKEMNGLIFTYENVERLGVDRCLAMIGAYDGCGVLVIDAGSAITADFVDGNGRHCGGYILPGYSMSKSALLGETAKIGVVAGLGGIEPGRSTASCVDNGFGLLYWSLIDGFIKTANSMGIYKYIVTGGDAELLMSLGRERLVLLENLVLDGLYKYSVCCGGVSEVGL